MCVIRQCPNTPSEADGACGNPDTVDTVSVLHQIYLDFVMPYHALNK
jgi:hypothetical protein